MKSNYFLFNLLVVCCCLSDVIGQTQIKFEAQINEAIPGVYQSSVSYADINNDGSIDVLTTGYNSDNIPTTKLYKNNGGGSFSEVFNTSFVQVTTGATAFIDIDGDGDQDVLITGYTLAHQRVAKLYKNEGNSVFTEVQGTPFTPVNYSSVAVSDVDGDGDQDILISGYANANQRITQLFLNNGNGIFTLSVNSFENLSSGDVAFADVNNDGFPDIFITGDKEEEQPVSQLYLNDGTGSYTLSTSTFQGVSNSAIAFADVDNDGDQDLVITGQINPLQDASILYKNDGNGMFTLSANFTGIRYGSVAFSDIDGDGDKDLLITGFSKAANLARSELYRNDGNGNYTAIANHGITPLKNGTVVFADFDNDGDQDLLSIGQIEEMGVSTILYENDGSGNFENMSSIFLGVRHYGKVKFVDIDGDGDQDALIIGVDPFSSNGITALYINDGTGNYVRKTDTGLTDMRGLTFAIGDIDGDGDLDLILNGGSYVDGNQDRTKVYKNDGDGHFTLVNGTPFPNTTFNEILFADVDGDGDQDVFVLGGSNAPVTKLYLNDGNGNFSESSQSFPQVFQGMAAFADVDNDGDLDLIFSGAQSMSANTTLTKLYINNGAGNFTEALGMPFTNFTSGTVVFADVDGDNDLDVIFSGLMEVVSVSSSHTKLYLNDGSGNYTLDTVNSFPNAYFSDIAFADVDNDGDLDMLFHGYYYHTVNSALYTSLYLNNGSGEFTQYEDVPFMKEQRASLDFGDIDGDGDPDVLISGGGKTVLYKNITCFSTFNPTVSVSNNILTADITNVDYNWVDCNHNYQSVGVTTQSFEPTQNGSYAVEITQYGGCTITSDCVELSVLGVDEDDLQNTVSIFPNPVHSTLKITSDFAIDDYLIYSIEGNLVQKGKVIHNQIDVSRLNPGVYILNIITEQNNLITTKFIKE